MEEEEKEEEEIEAGVGVGEKTEERGKRERVSTCTELGKLQ